MGRQFKEGNIGKNTRGWWGGGAEKSRGYRVSTGRLRKKTIYFAESLKCHQRSNQGKSNEMSRKGESIFWDSEPE